MSRELETMAHSRPKKAVAWQTVLVPIELSERMVRVIARVNERRPFDKRLVSKSGFMVAAIADAVDEAERGLGIK